MHYSDIFHPAAPVDNPAFLVGRQQELNELNTLLEHKAEHPVIVGPRGIGKTSLLKVVSSNRPDVGEVNCTTHSTFDHIAKSILYSLGFDVMVLESVQKTGIEIKGSLSFLNTIETGSSTNDKQEKKRLEIGQVEVDEHLLFRILVETKRPILITIDEYDLVQDKATKIRIADFIKMISDNKVAHTIRIVFAGVANSKRALIGAHASVSRQTHEVYLHPLRSADFLEYMTRAENELGIRINRKAKEEISAICLGQPYYMHLLCIEALEVMHERDTHTRSVTYDDFQDSRDRATKKAYNDHLYRFGPALAKIKKDEIAFNTLKILCELAKPEIPRPELFKYAENTRFQALTELKKGLEFLQNAKIIFVSKDGKTVKFSDPLLKPFLLLRFRELRRKKASQQLELFQP